MPPAPQSRPSPAAAPRPLIALDFTRLDAISPLAGQYRYVVDLVRALDRLAPEADFLLLGSRPSPVPELADVFAPARRAWTYRRLVPSAGAAAEYRDHLRYGAALRASRVRLLHALHAFVPALAPCPVVATVYDLMFEVFDEYAPAARSRPYRIYRWLARHRVRRLIAISEATAADLRRLWSVDGARIDVVPLGSSFIRPEAGPGPPAQDGGRPRSGGPVLAAPFNLEPRKNLAALLEAVRLLLPRFPGLVVNLFGNAAVTAAREAEYQRRLAQLELHGVVRRVGELDDAALRRLYRDADVFVFPSLYEGFGLPLLEAMSCGACVVARRASAMAEVVGEAGLLVETREPAAIAGAVTSLLDDAERRRRLAGAARRRAAAFTLERMARDTFRSYQRALGAGATP